jgi:GNAT superfamily N-acetyltransferase
VSELDWRIEPPDGEGLAEWRRMRHALWPARRQGAARRLVEAVQQWAGQMKCSEMASDALLENTDSHGMHLGLGFEETERVVYFRKVLTQ